MKVIQAKFAHPVLIGTKNYQSITIGRIEFNGWEMSFDKGLLIINAERSSRHGTDGESCWVIGLPNIAFMKISAKDNPHLVKEIKVDKTPPETSTTKLPGKKAAKNGKGIKSKKS